MVSQEIYDLAKKKALQSRCKYCISAIGFDLKGRVIATACNAPRFDYEGGGSHAEMVLLRKMGQRVKTLLLCRVGRDGKIRRMDPCPACKRVLDKLGIKVLKMIEEMA